jgi:hypothetical protein
VLQSLAPTFSIVFGNFINFSIFLTGNNMPTPDQCEATYHCGIGKLLTAAYRREFSMLEKGKCKTKFPTFDKCHAVLNAGQRQRVDKVLIEEYGE